MGGREGEEGGKRGGRGKKEKGKKGGEEGRGRRQRERDLLGNNVHDGGVQGADSPVKVGHGLGFRV